MPFKSSETGQKAENDTSSSLFKFCRLMALTYKLIFKRVEDCFNHSMHRL